MLKTKTKSFKELSDPIYKDPRRSKKLQKIRDEMDAVELSELRNSLRTTQEQLAKALNTTQENVSRIERQEDLYLSTLSDYVVGLGGHLEISAVFGDHRVNIEPKQKD